jgi:hypothetical protein
VNKRNDKAVHINPRLDEKAIVFNCQAGGEWMTEERTSSLPSVCLSSTLTVNLLLENKKVRFAVNGSHLYLFEHGQSLDHLTALLIEGDVRVHWIKFDDNRLRPFDRSLISRTNFGCIRPATPFRTVLPFQEGHIIRIWGVPLSDTEWFQINLDEHIDSIESDAKVTEGSDQRVLFHLSVRPDQRSLVRNSYDNGWQTEEYDCFQFPFAVNRPFTCSIKADKDKFLVEVDGVPCFSFKHRWNPMKMVRQIRISGAVNLDAFRHDSSNK